MTNIAITEDQDIEQRALKVSNLLRKSAVLWLEIAKEVNDAKHNLSPNAYSVFLAKAGLTTSIADKMPRIAKDATLYSDEMKNHIKKFEGWSTLYEFAKLSSSEKWTFINQLDDEPDTVVCRTFIQSFKARKSCKPSSKIVVVKIEVDENDILRFDYNQFLDLKDRIDEISRVIDRMSPAVSLTINEKNMSDIENIIVNSCSNVDTEYNEHCDELLPVTMPAANNDCSFSEVAI